MTLQIGTFAMDAEGSIPLAVCRGLAQITINGPNPGFGGGIEKRTIRAQHFLGFAGIALPCYKGGTLGIVLLMLFGKKELANESISFTTYLNQIAPKVNFLHRTSRSDCVLT